MISERIMATLNIDPPKQFNFSDPDDWPRWRKRFEHFCDTSGLSAAAETCQIRTLLYCLGEERDDVLSSTNITEEQQKKYDEVLAKFDEHFKVRQNIIFERAKFNRKQRNLAEGIRYKHKSGKNHDDLPQEFKVTHKKCTCCGKPQHPQEKCPAKDATCYKCLKRGHYSSMCPSKKTTTDSVQGTDTITVSDNDEDVDDNFLGTVDSKQKTLWLTELKMNDMTVTFKIDTGAEVSAISETTLRQLQTVQLKKPTRNLYGPAMSPLKVIGQFTANLGCKHTSCKQIVFVVKDLKQNLLGLPAITSLNLISRLNSLSLSSTNVQKLYPQLFQGLDTLGDEYEVSLKNYSKAIALHAARNVPLPLCSKVHDELKRMEAMGVISPVSEPSPWCSGMVVIPKPSGQVRICVDLKHLNQNVQREYHPLPCVKETLAQLTGA